MKVELDILWLEGEQHKLHELGINTEGNYSLKTVTFYSIANIAEYKHYDKPSCLVSSNGMEYITDLPYYKVKELIDSQLKS